MKRGWRLVAILALATVGAFALCYWIATREMRDLSALPHVEWVVREFQLDDIQAAHIRKLHAEFEPRCEEMCRRIGASNGRLDALLAQSRSVTPEVQAALRESAQLSAECRQHTLDHLYSVAAAMPPAQAVRYLDLMKARILRPGVPHPAIAASAENDARR